MAYANPRIRRLLLLVALVGLLFVILTGRRIRRLSFDPRIQHANQQAAMEGSIPEKAMVIPKMKSEQVKWALSMKDWHPYIYSTSDPPEAGYMTVPALRGRETIPYLTFVIDYYDKLPKYTAFIHSNMNQWHNDILGPTTKAILQNLRLETVDRDGFVNLRCSHDPGCPIGVAPRSPTQIDIDGNDTRAFFADIYMELFDVPPSGIPQDIGNVCCAQFIVSKKRILERPKKDYERMRTWAIESNVTDSFGVGWVMEKVWHIAFGMPAIFCPPFEQCRCDLFGWCDDKIPNHYRHLVKGAHPLLGSVFGRRWGNNNAAGNWLD